MNKQSRASRKVEAMAKAMNADPARAAETRRLYAAVVTALNCTHSDGEQDALCLLEALATVLAQITGAAERRARNGMLAYVKLRAEQLVPDMAPPHLAQHIVVPDDWKPPQ